GQPRVVIVGIIHRRGIRIRLLRQPVQLVVGEGRSSATQDPPSGKREWGTQILLPIQRTGHPPRDLLGDTDELAPTVHNSSYRTIYQLSIGIYEVLVSKLVRGERRKRTPRPTLWKTRVGHPNSTSHSTSGPPAIFSLSFGFGDGHEKEAANTMTPDHLSKG